MGIVRNCVIEAHNIRVKFLYCIAIKIYYEQLKGNNLMNYTNFE